MLRLRALSAACRAGWCAGRIWWRGVWCGRCGRLPPRYVGLLRMSGWCWVVGSVRSVCSQNAREACVFSAWPACRWASCRRLSSSGCGDPRIARGAAGVSSLVGRGAAGCGVRLIAGSSGSFVHFVHGPPEVFSELFFWGVFPGQVGCSRLRGGVRAGLRVARRLGGWQSSPCQHDGAGEALPARTADD